MRKLKALMFAFSLMLVASVGVTQDYFFRSLDAFFAGETIGEYMTATDTDVALLVKYIGTANTMATITVGGAAVDTLTFMQDDTNGSTTASTEFECPVSGALGGVVDLTDASCDTLGEVVDIINASTGWRAVILDGFRTDIVDGTTGGFLADAADQDCQSVVGDKLLWDSSEPTSEVLTIALTNKRSMADYLGGPGATGDLFENPFQDWRTALLRSVSTVNSSAAGTWQIYSVLVDNDEGGGAETVSTLINRATQDNSEDDFNYYPYGVMGKKGEKLVLRWDDPGTIAAATLTWSAYGIEWEYAR